MTQTTEGTGPGSVDRLKSRIINGDVKDSNLLLSTVVNNSSDLESVELIKSPDGTATNNDGKNLVIKGGEGYPEAGIEDNADGGDVVISGGVQHGDGNSGSVIVNGGDSSTEGDNSDAGDLTLRGGDGIGPGDSDGGSVTVRGGDCGRSGSDGEAGIVYIRGGNSIGSSAGDVIINGGTSGTNAYGGQIRLQAGYGVSGSENILLDSLVCLPVFATQVDRNNGNANHPNPRNGMICYVTELNAITVYVNGSWQTLNTSAIS